MIVFGLYDAGVPNDRLPWVVTGPPILGSFSLGAGLALLAASQTKKK